MSVWAEQTQLELQTSAGNIQIQLFDDQAPQTTDNFKQYVKDGFYDGTIFHRVIPNFMIQAGGFEPSMQEKFNTKPSIANEASNGLKNQYGRLAMARTNDPNSARSQFFINVKDNDFLNADADQAGYAVFAEVTQGMEIVEKIAKSATINVNGHANVPKQPIIIKKVIFIENK